MEQAMNAFLQLILEMTVRVLTPIALAAGIGLIGVVIQWVRQWIGERRWNILTEALRYAIYAAEQSGLSGAISNEGQVKKRLAIDLAEEFLAERGIHIDLDRLAALIEAELAQTINYDRINPSRWVSVPAATDSTE